VRNRAYCHKT